MMIAEESTSWPRVSRPVDHGGLGFSHKWNMGWMHDTLGYFAHDPVHRRCHHRELTFGLLYAFSENFVLPLSHDEVVHGKGSLLNKMPGDEWQRFANLRALYGWMWAYPGDQLLFMGGELAQWARVERGRRASTGRRSTGERHRGVQELVRALNRVARRVAGAVGARPRAGGFQWLDADDADHSCTPSCGGRPTVARWWPASPTSRRCRATATASGCRGPASGRCCSTPTPRTSAAPATAARAAAWAADDEPHQGQPASAFLTLPPLGCSGSAPPRP